MAFVAELPTEERAVVSIAELPRAPEECTVSELGLSEEDIALDAVDKTAATCIGGHLFNHGLPRSSNCSGCKKVFRNGELAMNCTRCEWHLCAACYPPQCPSGHALHQTEAAAGICDGCKAHVAKGSMVMDCAQCNWYLCDTCCPRDRITECPKGHRLQLWTSQSFGTCDVCGKAVSGGEVVMDCRQCDWYVCDGCHRRKKPSSAKVLLSQVIASLPTPVMVPFSPKCALKEQGLPTTASEAQQCPGGHPLQPWAAAAGCCDGCNRPVHRGQMVMDCRSCNWYLCSMCHLATPR